MDGLKSKFYPDWFLAVELFQKLQNLRAETVRAGIPMDRATMSGCRWPLLKMAVRCPISHRCWCKLENMRYISDRAFSGEQSLLALDLFCDGEGGGSGKVAGTAGAAEDTAALPQTTIPVGTGHSTVQCDFVDFFTKPLSEHKVQRVVRFFSPAHQ